MQIKQKAEKFNNEYKDAIARRVCCVKCRYHFLICVSDNRDPVYCPVCGKTNLLVFR